MAKTIKLTAEILESIKNEFLEKLATAKFSDGKISYQKTFGTVARKATIVFKETAWIKMQELVRRFDTEIGWHGVAFRGEDPAKDEYIITDILVYPQDVGAATVTTDQVEYQNWLMGQPDEVFNNLRMQGHSHVNMSTSPSGVDTTLYDGILSQMDDTMFYIFMIWNKKGDKTIKLYDMAKNILFETADCTVEIEPDEIGIEEFIKAAKNVVRKSVGMQTSWQSSSVFGSGYNGSVNTTPSYYGYSYSTQAQQTPKVAVDSGFAKPAAAPAPVKKEEQKKENDKTVRRGKRRDKKEEKPASKTSHYSSWYGDDDSSDYWERWK